MTTEELCVIAFDVASDKRRYRLTRVLEGYGHRVQESVFEAWLDEVQHQRLLVETSSVLDVNRDRLVCYRLSSDDLERVRSLGLATPPSNPEFHLL